MAVQRCGYIKTTEWYTLNQGTVCSVNYISIKLSKTMMQK